MPINNSKSLAEKYAEMDLNSTKAYARKEGIAEGEDKLGKLVIQLLSLERYDDIKKVAVDKNFRNKLYNEFGID
jgi:hypothetical protein